MPVLKIRPRLLPYVILIPIALYASLTFLSAGSILIAIMLNAEFHKPLPDFDLTNMESLLFGPSLTLTGLLISFLVARAFWIAAIDRSVAILDSRGITKRTRFLRWRTTAWDSIRRCDVRGRTVVLETVDHKARPRPIGVSAAWATTTPVTDIIGTIRIYRPDLVQAA